MPKGARWPKYTKTLSGNSLKGSNIQHKKRKIHAAGKKDAGILYFFTWPYGGATVVTTKLEQAILLIIIIYCMNYASSIILLT
jgi:hypothetical protein